MSGLAVALVLAAVAFGVVERRRRLAADRRADQAIRRSVGHLGDVQRARRDVDDAADLARQWSEIAMDLCTDPPASTPPGPKAGAPRPAHPPGPAVATSPSRDGSQFVPQAPARLSARPGGAPAAHPSDTEEPPHRLDPVGGMDTTQGVMP